MGGVAGGGGPLHSAPRPLPSRLCLSTTPTCRQPRSPGARRWWEGDEIVELRCIGENLRSPPARRAHGDQFWVGGGSLDCPARPGGPSNHLRQPRPPPARHSFPTLHYPPPCSQQRFDPLRDRRHARQHGTQQVLDGTASARLRPRAGPPARRDSRTPRARASPRSRRRSRPSALSSCTISTRPVFAPTRAPRRGPTARSCAGR